MNVCSEKKQTIQRPHKGKNDASEFRGEICSDSVVRVRSSEPRPVVVLVHEPSLGEDTPAMKQACVSRTRPPPKVLESVLRKSCVDRRARDRGIAPEQPSGCKHCRISTTA
jgi:hypothetical protein